jgi:excinuclease ABC subunit A
VSLPELYSRTLSEVQELFSDVEALDRILNVAGAVGLGYLVLRQSRHALSGGEAQRLKITSELCRKDRGETLYILDEPTVGQHMEDLSGLVRVLDRLVEGGHTVVAIEHHPHFLACCDWLVELGPGAGFDGGRIIAEGTPESLAQKETPTAPHLREAMRIG